MSATTGAAPDAALWLLVLLPASVGGILAAVGHRADRAAAAVAVVTAAAVTALAAAVAATRPAVTVAFIAGAPFGLGVDALSALVVLTVAAVTLLVLVFAAGDVHEHRARFFGLMLVFAASVALTATATTLPALLLAWEVMGAASFALIGFPWREDRRVASGTTAFLTTRSADLGLYVAAAAALAGGSGLGLADLPAASPGWRSVIAAGVLLAALGKAAQLPFSFWLSRAMDGPSPVSALLHSAAMVAMGGYLLLRVVPLLQVTGWAATTAAWVGALTALLLGAVALAQRDLKQLLAASTCAQLGFVVLAAGTGSVYGGAVHLVAHAATKALLFLAAGAWLSALGTKQLDALRGAARRWPLVGVCAGVGLLCLAGVVPLSLWATKDQVLAAARATSPALYAVGLAAAAVSAAYAGKAVVVVWSHLPTGVRAGYDTERPGTRRVGVLQEAPLVVLAAGAALLGVLALPVVADPLRRALGEASAAAPGAGGLAVSAALALAVVTAVALRGVPEPSWAARWLGLEAAAHRVVVRPVLGLAGHLARFDDAGLDRAVGATARGGLALARVAARFDTGGVDAAVRGVASGVRRLAALARRAQTGQLHQYYAQVVVALAVAVVLLVTISSR